MLLPRHGAAKWLIEVKEVQCSALSSDAVPEQIIDCSSQSCRYEITRSLLHEVKRLHFCSSVFEIRRTADYLSRIFWCSEQALVCSFWICHQG